MKLSEWEKRVLGISVGILLASSMRIFVSGAYASLEKTFFYGVMFPSGLGIILFLLSSFIVGKIRRKTGAIIVGIYALASLITDATEYTHLIAAFVLPVALAVLKEAEIKYVLIGLVGDLALRILAVGGEPIDFIHTRVLLVIFILALACVLWKEQGQLKSPGFELYGFAVLINLGLIYPNAIMRYSGIETYYLTQFVAYSFVVALAILVSPYLTGKKFTPFLLIGGALTLFVQPFGIIGMPIALASALALLEGAKKSRFGVLGALYFVVVSVLAIGAYVGRDIGIPFMEDHLEALITFSAIVYAFSSKSMSIKRPNIKEVAVPIVGLVVVSLLVLATFHPSPITAEKKTEIIVWSYNLHQGFAPYKGSFNGNELVKLLKTYNSDIIAAQEVVGGMIGDGYQDVPLLLSAYFGYYYEYTPAVEGTYGVATFSRWPLEIIEERNLKSIGQARPAQKVRIKSVNLTLVNVHMGLSPEERALQAEELLEVALKEPMADMILGDTNAEPEEEAIKILLREYYDSFAERPPYTFNWGNVDIENIDYILIRRGSTLKVKDYGWFLDVEVSDHRPIYVLISK
ncbi:metal-dependent hydrolase [Thermococcus sp. EP1]|uniref:endonuclease/exonuclease/phosphatase family protein n=1 Tax=Thermococcus sp. EP1 TaxID=1591054 RepID=UPI0006DAFEB3|nr:endonuclease/exonuclease/phosphatase family protein [Thermococcus sp. EP1]KPU63554.1 metal-dependent hydrolase [Thermococcus sp. EP1]